MSFMFNQQLVTGSKYRCIADLELRLQDSQITYQFLMKPKICKTSIFHELFLLKDIFKIISTNDICLSIFICLDLNEQN